MGDVMKKVRSGDRLRIPAQTFNTFIDAARDFQFRQRDQRRDPGRRVASSGIVPVKNSSGSDRDRFDVLGIDGPIFTHDDNPDSFKNQPTVDAVEPTADHVGRFVILLAPVQAGGVGPGLVSGVSPVQISISDEDHRFADVEDGTTSRLESVVAGAAEILWAEAGAGPAKWALVKVGVNTDERVRVSHDDIRPGYLRRDDDDDLQAHHKVAGSVEDLVDSVLPTRNYADDAPDDEGWIQVEVLSDDDDNEQLVIMHTLPGGEEYYFDFDNASPGEGQMWELSLDALGHVRYTRGCLGYRRGPYVDED